MATRRRKDEKDSRNSERWNYCKGEKWARKQKLSKKDYILVQENNSINITKFHNFAKNFNWNDKSIKNLNSVVKMMNSDTADLQVKVDEYIFENGLKEPTINYIARYGRCLEDPEKWLGSRKHEVMNKKVTKQYFKDAIKY